MADEIRLDATKDASGITHQEFEAINVRNVNKRRSCPFNNHYLLIPAVVQPICKVTKHNGGYQNIQHATNCRIFFIFTGN